jgi:hypothetical protein
MEKEKSKILVRDVHSKQTLFECDLVESDRAYKFAAEMETMGLDVEVISPTLTETLSSSLGLTNDQIREYKNSLDEEIEGHDGSCCFEDSKGKPVH